MPRLLLINGLPGTGKSTLARRYVADRPLALRLDVDVVRGLLGAWSDEPVAAGLLARRMALAMARIALGEGHDVVVPQFLGRPDFVDQLEALADEPAVEFVETVLVEPLEVTRSRLAQRAAGPLTEAQRDAHATLDRAGPDALAAMHARLQQLLASRPATRAVRPVPGDVERTYRTLLAAC